MLRGVVHGEPDPTASPPLSRQNVPPKHCGMRAQIVHHQVDDVRLRVTNRDLQQVIGKLGGGTGARHFREVPSRFRLDPAKHVGRATTLVFAIAPRHASRPHSQRRTNLLVKDHRFLVHSNHRFLLGERLFIHDQHLLHARDVFPHPAPPRGQDRSRARHHRTSQILCSK